MASSGPFTESVKVVDLLQRPFSQLPMATDLPRLTNVRVVDEKGRSGYEQPSTGASTLDKLEYTFVALTALLLDEKSAAETKVAFREHFTEGIDVSKLQMESFLNKIGGDESPVVQVLKAVNQSAISPAIIHLKLKLGLINMTKDVRDSWFYEIIVSSSTGQVVVASHKRDQCVKNNFQYEWVMAVHFDKFPKDTSTTTTNNKVVGGEANEKKETEASEQQQSEPNGEVQADAAAQPPKGNCLNRTFDCYFKCTNVSLTISDLMYSLALHTANLTKRNEIAAIVEPYASADVLSGALTRHWEFYPASAAAEQASTPRSTTPIVPALAKPGSASSTGPSPPSSPSVQVQHGVKEYDNGDRYDGGLANGIREGEGKYRSATSGIMYEGGYKDGKRHGQGKFTFPYGAVLDGMFQRGRVVHGNYIFSNGDKYIGDFKDDKFEGQGEWKGVNGDFYRGAWKAGLRHGKGTVNLAHGDIYDGEFQNDLMHGFGKYHFVNGDLYMGQFAYGQIHGMGEYKFSSNAKSLLGEFAHGKLVKPSSTTSTASSSSPTATASPSSSGVTSTQIETTPPVSVNGS